MTKNKTYIVDIDGTICSNTEGDYGNAIPFRDRIAKINKLYDEGHKIIYFTARGMSRYEGNAFKAYKHFYEFTKNQFDGWGVKYHELRLGKIIYDLWIDDKAINDKGFFDEKI